MYSIKSTTGYRELLRHVLIMQPVCNLDVLSVHSGPISAGQYRCATPGGLASNGQNSANFEPNVATTPLNRAGSSLTACGPHNRLHQHATFTGGHTQPKPLAEVLGAI